MKEMIKKIRENKDEIIKNLSGTAEDPIKM